MANPPPEQRLDPGTGPPLSPKLVSLGQNRATEHVKSTGNALKQWGYHNYTHPSGSESVLRYPQILLRRRILFEAGALVKSVAAGSVVPYLLDIEFSDVTGPLTQFQAKKADQTSTLDLVRAINHSAKEPVPIERLEDLFGLVWPRLDLTLSSIPRSVVAGPPVRQTREVLEELVQVVRAVEQRTRVLESVFLAEPLEIPELPIAPDALCTGRALTCIFNGNPPLAVKIIRDGTSLGLKEAKGLVVRQRGVVYAPATKPVTDI